jgi:hypothetical protein
VTLGRDSILEEVPLGFVWHEPIHRLLVTSDAGASIKVKRFKKRESQDNQHGCVTVISRLRTSCLSSNKLLGDATVKPSYSLNLGVSNQDGGFIASSFCSILWCPEGDLNPHDR